MSPKPFPVPAPYNALDPALAQPTDLGDGICHHWSVAERNAVIQAWASGRPLLIRGEAGCGKSQLAMAVARELHVDCLKETIHPRFEATDLLYKEDPVRRLAHAQLIAASGGGGLSAEDIDKRLDKEKFAPLGKLGQAYEAKPTCKEFGLHLTWPSAVVLIDEIDKADSDLPNALLGVLGDRSFQLPWDGAPTVSADGKHLPLVLITTNEDREMPPAFLRRCAVLSLQPPADKAGFMAWLVTRAKAHAGLKEIHDVFSDAAEMVWKDREALRKRDLPTVGLAEMLDLLYAVHVVSGGKVDQARAAMEELAPYALDKHADPSAASTGE